MLNSTQLSSQIQTRCGKVVSIHRSFSDSYTNINCETVIFMKLEMFSLWPFVLLCMWRERERERERGRTSTQYNKAPHPDILLTKLTLRCEAVTNSPQRNTCISKTDSNICRTWRSQNRGRRQSRTTRVQSLSEDQSRRDCTTPGREPLWRKTKEQEIVATASDQPSISVIWYILLNFCTL